MPRMSRIALPGLALVVTACTAVPAARDAAPSTVWIRLRDGTSVTGLAAAPVLRFTVGDLVREVPFAAVLSLHLGDAASAYERERIDRDLPLLAAADRQQAAVATDELLAIGVPVVTPLLQGFGDVDTDAREPDSRYRLFARLLPAGADAGDRTLDLLRLDDGTLLRGRFADDAIEVAGHGRVNRADLRTLAVRRARVTKTFELHALHDCTYVDWVTTGIVPTAAASLRADAQGFVRLSFDEDGWATGPDGLFETLPGKRKMQEGFRWGCVLYRVGPGGPRRFAGSHLDARNEDGTGMLQFVVNDNEHWQNNIGAYLLTVTATDAFDVGPAH